MAELEELEQEDLDAQLLEVGPMATDDLPSVPTAEPAASSSSKHRDIFNQVLGNREDVMHMS